MKKLLAVLLINILLSGAGYARAADSIQPFGADSLNRIKASHSGKPFVLMLWALDCTYCQPSLHALAEIQRTRNIDIVTISTDRADETNRPLIRKKLADAGLKSETWAFGPAPAEQLRYAVDPKWRGETPRSYWFDREGKPIAHTGTISADMADKMLPK